VSDDGKFRLEKLPDTFSNGGEVYEGVLRADVDVELRNIIESDELKQVGTVADINRRISYDGNLIRIVVPRAPRQVIAYVETDRKPDIPKSVQRLLEILKTIDKSKGEKIKGAQPRFCEPLQRRVMGSRQ
jgi:hypothetical protein